MTVKTEQLQIRLTRSQKSALRRLARDAGQDLSTYVLTHVIPAPEARLSALLQSVGEAEGRRYALAELNSWLTSLTGREFVAAVRIADVEGLPPLDQNYVAAMIEHAALKKGVAPPAWTASVAPLQNPWFATSLKGLRLHLLRASPVAFKRRNLFVDSSIGDQV